MVPPAAVASAEAAELGSCLTVARMIGTVHRCGERALLVEVGDIDPDVFGRALHPGALPGLIDVVPGAATVLLHFSGTPPPVAALDAVLAAAADEVPVGAGEPVVVPIDYCGEDLPTVAELSGLSVAEVAERHSAAVYRVAFVGFSPGFAYLSGGDPLLAVPRRATPRPAVPAGSVALASTFCGIYPRRSPGGWQLIGRTALQVWDPRRNPPALLVAGTAVRFVPC